MTTPRTVVGLISLEPWDRVWRRNQHLVSALLQERLVDEVIFVNPPTFGLKPGPVLTPMPHVQVVRPVLRLPKRLGGLRLLGKELRRGALGRTTHLWINDPLLGVHCRRQAQHVIYDVTDDWRESVQTPRALNRLISAEDELASTARTVVCSEVLKLRWKTRYGVDACLVPNAISASTWLSASIVTLNGPAPHIGYVGTLHQERLDIELVAATADAPGIGTVHLVGPNHLVDTADDRLKAIPNIQFHGEIDSTLVPSVMKSMDVLILPHLVSDFTLSLDAIKAYEYAASGRPVVATPTSGFQTHGDSIEAASVVTSERKAFVAAVVALAHEGMPDRPTPTPTWVDRAEIFAEQLLTAPLTPVTRSSPARPVRARRRLSHFIRLKAMNSRSPRAAFMRGCQFGARITLLIEGEGWIHAGEQCVIDRGTTLSSSGLLTIGPRSILGHNVTIAAKESIQIGQDCMLGEMVSIRDHDHASSRSDVPMREQDSVVRPVLIGDDVWLGARVVVVKGVTIGRGSIVGAGSVVVKDLPAGSVATGTSARVIRTREWQPINEQ